MSVVDELNKFGKYVVQQSKSNLSKKKKKDTSALYNGVKYTIEVGNRATTLRFDFGTANDYWEFVDKGVKGVSSSAKAPMSPFKFGTGNSTQGIGLRASIEKWVTRKRIQFINKETRMKLSYRNTAFVISRSIWHKGLATTNFFTKPFEQAFQRLPDDIYEAYSLQVEEQLKVRLKL